MAFGEHWEWRGFGSVAPALRKQITALEPLYRSEQPLSDVYLWTPACDINVKLRQGTLKYKRLLAAREPFERWLEDEDEIYPFPLDQALVTELVQALGVDITAGMPDPITEVELRRYLGLATPPVRIITVAKQRSAYLWPFSKSEPARVELSDITIPEPVTTISLEHPDLELIQTVYAALKSGLLALRRANYLQALAVWAAGGGMTRNAK